MSLLAKCRRRSRQKLRRPTRRRRPKWPPERNQLERRYGEVVRFPGHAVRWEQ
jgi:hypothetical protein